MDQKYKFTASEYAQMCGIGTSALRKRRLKGKLEGQYILENNCYLYARHRPIKDVGTPVTGPKFTLKKRRRDVPRDKTKYTNRFFKEHNEQKMLKKLNETDPDFIKNYQKYKEIHQREKQQEIFRNSVLTVKNYGGFIRGATPFIVKHSTGFKALVPEEKDEYEKALDEAEADSRSTGKYYW